MAARLPFSFFPRHTHLARSFCLLQHPFASLSPGACSAYTSLPESNDDRGSDWVLRYASCVIQIDRTFARETKLDPPNYGNGFRFRRACLCEIERYIKRQNGVWLFCANLTTALPRNAARKVGGLRRLGRIYRLRIHQRSGAPILELRKLTGGW